MNAPFLRPVGCPVGVNPSDWRKALMDRIDQQAAVLTALVDALDAMEGDADSEPWLGANEPVGSDIAQLYWASGTGNGNGSGSGSGSGSEEENEHGGDVQDEPHDYLDEGNGDYCLADEVPTFVGMSDAQRDATWDEAERLAAQARAMLPPPTILRFERRDR